MNPETREAIYRSMVEPECVSITHHGNTILITDRYVIIDAARLPVREYGRNLLDLAGMPADGLYELSIHTNPRTIPDDAQHDLPYSLRSATPDHMRGLWARLLARFEKAAVNGTELPIRWSTYAAEGNRIGLMPDHDGNGRTTFHQVAVNSAWLDRIENLFRLGGTVYLTGQRPASRTAPHAPDDPFTIRWSSHPPLGFIARTAPQREGDRGIKVILESLL